MDRRLEVEQLRRSIATLRPGAREPSAGRTRWGSLPLESRRAAMDVTGTQGPTGTIGLVPQEIWALMQLVTR